MLTGHKNLRITSSYAALRPGQRISLTTHRGRRRSVSVAARLTAKGKAISADQIVVKKSLGEGSYGQVFEGILDTGMGEEERVVLKRTKARVEGAAEMAQMEHIINVYASKAAKGSIAEFLGYCEVSPREANSRLTEGLWLMWRYEGQNTLAYYLRRRDTLRSLARDLGCPEEIVVPVAMRQLLLGLSALHNAGLVHRDVKPLNIIASERDGRLKLIDLGAAADLRTGTNYSPEESILDPIYCPPEQYVLPTDSPHLAKSAFAIALSPMLWAQHKPDRFDSWSAGIVMLQLVIPGLRQVRGVNLFKTEYERAEYDLEKWRKNCRWISKRDTAVLDANDGAGWDLAQALLRPRSIRIDDDGKIYFVSQAGFARVGAQEALKHPFLRPAAEFEKSQAQALRRSLLGSLASASSVDESYDEGPTRGGSGSRDSKKLTAAANGRSGSGSSTGSGRAKVSGSWWGKKSRSGSSSTTKDSEADEEQEEVDAAVAGGGVFTAAAGLWRGLQDKLFDLEARMIKTASRTAKQVARVNALEEKVAKGQADPAALARAKGKLGQMQQQLDTLEDEKETTASRASSLLSFLGISSGSKQQPKQQQQQPKETSDGSGSSRSGWLGRRAKPAEPPPPAAADVGSSSSNVLVQAWEGLGQQLMKLEGQLNEQQSRTEKQKVSVQKLQQKVKAGQASASELEQEKEKLNLMSSQLELLQTNYSKVKDQASSLLQRIQAATGSSPSSTGSAAAEPGSSSTAATGSSSSSGVGGAVSGAVSAGLKFSGLAMRVASSVASAVKDDASKFLKDLEQEAEAKRARRAAEGAFLQLLRSHTPDSTVSASPSVSPAGSPAPAAAAGGVRFAITVDSTYEEVKAALREEEAWKGVPSSSRRREMFSAYMEALRQVARERVVKAEKQLTDLLVKLNVGPESDWTEVSQVLAAHPLAFAVPPERRGELFDARVRQVVLERACAAAAERADNDFRALLQERADAGTISTAFSSWSSAKPVLWSDIRYQSLPEERRLELFNEFMGVLQQQAAAKTAVASPQLDRAAVNQSSTPAAPVSESHAGPAAADLPLTPPAAAVLADAAVSSSSSLDDSLSSMDLGAMTTADEEASMSPEDLAQLQLLRWEQAKLRADYMKMEAKLRAMEHKIRSTASSPVAGAPDADSSSSSHSGGNGAPGGEQHETASSSNSISVSDAVATAGSDEQTAADASSAAAAADPVAVVVSGGSGEVSVSTDADGVVVFKFADSNSRSSSRAE